MKASLDVVADGSTSVVEAARLLRLSRSPLYELMDSGHLRHVKIDKARAAYRGAPMYELAAGNRRRWRRGEES